MRRWSLAEKIAFGAVVVVAAVVLARPLFYADPAFYYVDDFFYYLVPAKNFLTTGKFFFDPATPTNGFHPLWMAVVVVLVAISNHHDFVFFVLFNATVAALIVATYHHAAALVRDEGGGPSAAIAAGLISSGIQLEIASSGMEVALTVPLLIWLTRRLVAKPVAGASTRELLLLGLHAAAVVLSRVDSALLVLVLAIAVLRRDKPTLREIAIAFVGTLPLWIDLGVNLALTGHVLPASGQAKTLKTTIWPGLEPIAWMLLEHGRYAIITPIGWIAAIAITFFLRPRRDATRATEFASAGAIAVVAFFVIQCAETDWPLWFWYKYPLAWLAPLACVKLAAAERPRLETLWVAFGAICVAASAWLMLHITPKRNWVWSEVLALSSWAREHPGHYAMGDCSGAFGYELGAPVLQTEGLSADATYLDYVKKQRPIRDALTDYRIDYYVVCKAHRGDDGCYGFREPILAGPHSKVMTGRACAEPVARGIEGAIFRATDVR